MNRQIGPPFQHAGFQFLYEQAFTSNLGQWRIEYFIALGCHSEQLDIQLRVTYKQCVTHMICLP
jgi:hypothetical protein